MQGIKGEDGAPGYNGFPGAKGEPGHTGPSGIMSLHPHIIWQFCAIFSHSPTFLCILLCLL